MKLRLAIAFLALALVAMAAVATPYLSLNAPVYVADSEVPR